VKVVDFGIAKLTDEELQPTQALTRTGEIFGSPLYMSPEQCLGKPVDHRSDIYSLGCVMFECLAGVPPFLGNTALSTMMQHQSSDAPSLKEATLGKDFPAEVENILQLMLKKDPAARYQSMSVVARELSLVQQGLFNLVQVPRDSTAKLEKGANYSPILYSLLACLVSGLLSSAAVYYSMNLRLQSAFYEGFRKGGESERNKLPPISNEKAFGSDDNRISKENSTPDKVAPDRKYSRIIKDNDGSLKRVFDFPLAATFGSLYLMDKDKRIKTKDINRRKFGLNEPFQLDVESADIAADPNFFLHFDNNELTGVRFRFNDGARDETFTFIDNQKSLKLLDLKSCKVTSRILDKLNSLPELTFLSVTRTGLTGKDLLKLKRLKKLTTLSMAHLPGQSKVLADIKGSPLLDTLEISAENLSEADFKCLSSFKNLRRLWIKDAGTITDKDLAWLGNLRGLQEFYLEPALSTAQIDKITQRLTRLNTIWVNPEVWSKNDIDRYQSKYPRIKILHDQSPPRL
jgi:hypothetical protein